MLYSLLIIVDVLIALAITAFILLQQGKGATAGASFGSGASSTVFGSRGSASFMTRATAILAALFFVNSLALAMIANNQTAPTSVVDKLNNQVQQEQSIPADDIPEGSDLPQKIVPQQETPEDLPQ